jgi:sulfite reductase (NADPH) flavoprotein alpha-component
VILVGSENNTSWGFARELHEQMAAAGRRVLSVDMNQLAEEYPQASMLFVLTSTYGDGGAPASANSFMQRLTHFRSTNGLSFAVLGFGDRQFAKFCQFAVDVDAALEARGLKRLAAIGFVDRQSTEQFNEWGNRIADVTGVPLALIHNPTPAPRFELALVDRADFGVAIQAPTSILHFGPVAGKNIGSLPDFDAGDLIGILPPGGYAPGITHWPRRTKTVCSKSACANSPMACAPGFYTT